FGALPGDKIALVPGAGRPLADEDWRIGTAGVHQNAKDAPATTLLIGSEREGLPREIVAAADYTTHIPIHIESLNAAMAATIALYELTRMARP
ncbi:MAG TPA: TrmH family RNA methyltransferase, partial [Solirubrobacteraceae bacterium]